MENNFIKINSFIKLNSINVQDKVEKKNGLTYLSWAYAWIEFKKTCPNATYEIIKNENGLPYFESDFGIICYTKVTVNDLTYEMWLPVMDGANKSMKKESYEYTTKYGTKSVDAASMFDINKTLMRCLVKNLAMFGLGLYIYAGEDLPEPVETKPVELDTKLLEKASQLGITPDKAAIVLKMSENELTNEHLNYLITKTEEKHKRLEEKESK